MANVTKVVALVLSGLLLLTGCAGQGQQEQKPSIVVTTNILADVVKNLVGEQAAVHTLMPPNVDPHSFEISAQQAALLQDADLVVSNGLNLEEGLSRQLIAVDEAEVNHFVATDHIELLNVPGANGAGDPHFWTDPARVVQVVDALEKDIEQITGISTGQLDAATGTYRQKLIDLDAQMLTAFSSIPSAQRQLVTNHHVFGYLADRFDLKVIGAVIPSGSTLASPSAADLASLSGAIREAQVSAIFVESAQPDKLARALASEAKIEVKIVDLYTESLSMAGQGAESYLQMMQANTKQISQALRG
ncbi:metal ABC transporter solute-binding protein, Zn/Mn family [Glutamicibacter bergerei]|jgi:zinc/manganese transport system substrate-binding protein|uniref:Metal ABC transporter solute-binding protein, Zn/Mn family n=1 Tax=Glutamicibacter bergerei TaxID=256702 RepID=A0ABV9MGF1_9MICC|nr:zinc ABC transporter substrate-binding protein [Micrococcaceae bacterium]